jgi:hypothetical protein
MWVLRSLWCSPSQVLVSPRDSKVWSTIKWRLNCISSMAAKLLPRFNANWHSFWRHGQTYYDFPCHIVSYPERHKLFDCVPWMSPRSVIGLTKAKGSLQYPRRTVLKWKELRHTDLVECWELANCSTKLNEWDFGPTRKITSVVEKLESKLKSVDGDVQQATSLLLVYYQK